MMKIIYAIVFATLMVTLSASAVTYVIPGNTTQQFNFTNSTNQTEFASFECRPLLVYTNVSNQTIISKNLDAGEIYNYESPFANLHFSCSQQNLSETNVCSLRRLLNPGEQYTRQAGVCDIDVKCQQELPDVDESVCLGVVQKNYTIPYSLKNNDGVVTFTFGDDEQRMPKNASFDFQSELFYQCEVPVDIEVKELGAELESICGQTNPYLLGWYDTTMKAYTTLQTNCDSNKDENRAVETQLRAEKASCDESRITCTSENTRKENQYNSCISDKDKVASEKNIWSATTIMLSVLTSLFFFIMVLFIYLYFREKNTRGL